MKDSIIVTGISSKGTKRVETYVYPMFVDNEFDAIRKVLEYADDEYSVEYTEEGKPIPNTEFKDFVQITSIIVNDTHEDFMRNIKRV